MLLKCLIDLQIAVMGNSIDKVGVRISIVHSCMFVMNFSEKVWQEIIVFIV